MAKNITFKRDADKERIDELLSGKRIRNRMPERIRGKCAPMVLWSIEYLVKLLNGGIDNLQAELFSDNSEEIEVMTLQMEKLKIENQKLHEKVMTLEDEKKKLENLEEGYIETINILKKRS